MIQLTSKGWLCRMKDAFTSISYVSVEKFPYIAKYNFLYWRGLPCLSHSHPFARSPSGMCLPSRVSAFQLSFGMPGLRTKLNA